MIIRLENSIYAAKLQLHITEKQYNKAGKFFLQKHFDLTEFVPKAIFHTMNIRPKEIHEQNTIQPGHGYDFTSATSGQKISELEKEYNYESQNRGYLYCLRPLR